MEFLYYIIPDSLALRGDTVAHDWRDIDSSFSSLRTGFYAIEQRFGPFVMTHEGDMGPVDIDTSILVNKIWYIKFSNIINIDSAVLYLSQLPDVNIVPGVGPIVEFRGYPRFYQGVDPKSGPSFTIWPQPCSTLLHIMTTEDQGGVALYSIIGKQYELPVRRIDKESVDVDVSHIPTGVYYCHFGTKLFTIIIER